MTNFFVMIMWMSGGDAMILGDASSKTLIFDTRKECEVYFLDLMSDMDTQKSIETQYTTGNPVLRAKNTDGSLRYLYTCEEVKF